MQERIARWYSIPVEAWEQPPGDTPLQAADDDEPPASSPTSALPNAPAMDADPASMTNLESVNRLIREIRAAATDPNATATTREKLARSELTALRFRHECEMRDLLTQDRVVAQHKEWRMVRDRLAYVVGGCERCARLITEALVELGV